MLLGWERLFRRGFDSGKNFPIWGAGMMLIVAGFVFYAKYKRRNNGTSPTAQPATAAAEASSIISEERRRQRRELILNSIIQKVNHKYLEKLKLHLPIPVHAFLILFTSKSFL